MHLDTPCLSSPSGPVLPMESQRLREVSSCLLPSNWYFNNGLVSGIPVLSTFYIGIFLVFDYTRNGLFYVPLFLLLGTAGIIFRRKVAVIGLLCSLTALIVEALLLHHSGIQRHDSMYLFFPFLMVFFSLLLEANKGERRSLRQLTTVVYMIHRLPLSAPAPAYVWRKNRGNQWESPC